MVADQIPDDLRSNPDRDWRYDPTLRSVSVRDRAQSALTLTLPGRPGTWAMLVPYPDGSLGVGVITEDPEAEQGLRTAVALLEPEHARQALEFLRADPG